MAVIIDQLKSDKFLLCYGFVGPNEQYELILRGDGLANEWIYPIVKPLDDVEVNFGTLYVKERGETIEQIKMNHKVPINLRKHFNKKITAITGNSLSYYIAFNPIPYTVTHEFDLVESSTKLTSIQKYRFIIPLLGTCNVNGISIKEKQYATVQPNKSVDVDIDSNSIAVVVTRNEL